MTRRVGLSLILVVVLAVVTAVSASGGARSTEKVKLPNKTIGVMGPVNAAEIINLGVSATSTAAKALGWKTITYDPQGDPAKMASGMTSLVNAKVDAIVLTSMEPATIQAGLRAAKKLKIPVINTLSASHLTPLYAGTYWPSPLAENNLLINHMTKSLPRGSKVAGIYLPQFYNALIAQNLFKASAKKQGWDIVSSHDADLANLVPDVKKAAGDAIRANPDLNAFWGCCDFATSGAVPAIQQSGKDVRLYSLHGVPSSIQFVKTGAADIEVADYQKGSFIAIDSLAAYWAKGKAIPKTTPKQFAFKMQVVTKATAGKGYPYPTSKILAQFKARWAKLYVPAG